MSGEMHPALRAFADGAADRIAQLEAAGVPPGAISLVLVGLVFGHLTVIKDAERRARVLNALEATLPKLLAEQRLEQKGRLN